MTKDALDIRSAVSAHTAEARKFLCDLISIPSLPGREQAAMDFCAEAFTKVASVEPVLLDNAIRRDADYSDPMPEIDYTGRSNLRVELPSGGGGRSLLLNTHIDTVPPSRSQDRPFEPRVADGAVSGRGACDAKGQVATIYLAMAAMRALGVRLKGRLAAHLVVEEEVGGNGTLAMVRRDERADGCIVFEPTELRVLTSIRGAVWFRIQLRGTAGHSGRSDRRPDALKMAARVIEILEDYHDRLLASSRGDELFDKYPDPMPLTIGSFHAGDWPAAVPDRAVIEGVLGLLANTTAAKVMDEITERIRVDGGPDIAANFDIHFMYRHDASVCPADHPLAETLCRCAADAGCAGGIGAMTASCDAWFYNNHLGIPTVVFGGGSLARAHAADEHMPLADLAAAAESLVRTAIAWCGLEK